MKFNFKEFKQILQNFIDELEKLRKEVGGTQDLKAVENKNEELKDKCISYCKSVLPSNVATIFIHESIYNHSGVKWGGYSTESKRRKALSETITERVQGLERFILLCKASDPIQKGFFDDEGPFDLSVSDKMELLIQKLYILRKTPHYWTAQSIYSVNQVELEDLEETRDISTMLEREGYAEVIRSSGYVFLKITTKGKFYCESLSAELNSNTSRKKKEMKIFISHSSKDSKIARSLIELIKTALNVQSSYIRCTSVDGYRLPSGASTDELLKQEVHHAEVLIGLISPDSTSSSYVMFELGARWGVSKPLIPLVIGSTAGELLSGPLSGINALMCTEAAQMQQFIGDLKDMLQLEAERPEVYQSKIDQLVRDCQENILASTESSNNLLKGQAVTPTHKSVQVDQQISSFCKRKWPEDYSMQLHCAREQKNASNQLSKGKPDDVPEDVYNNIVEAANKKWPEDFTMKLFSRDEQIKAYRDLNRP